MARIEDALTGPWRPPANSTLAPAADRPPETATRRTVIMAALRRRHSDGWRDVARRQAEKLQRGVPGATALLSRGGSDVLLEQ